MGHPKVPDATWHVEGGHAALEKAIGSFRIAISWFPGGQRYTGKGLGTEANPIAGPGFPFPIDPNPIRSLPGGHASPGTRHRTEDVGLARVGIGLPSQISCLEATTAALGLAMTRVLLIGLAGALGTVARYGVAMWARGALGATFPYGTLLVNVAGCFLIALVMQLSVSTSMIPETLRLTLTTGFMGGLTTYSAFDFETTTFVKERAWGTAALYVGVTLVVCFLAGLLGMAIAKRFAEA